MKFQWTHFYWQLCQIKFYDIVNNSMYDSIHLIYYRNECWTNSVGQRVDDIFSCNFAGKLIMCKLWVLEEFFDF